MARRKKDSLFEDLILAPWWVSVGLAVLVYFGSLFAGAVVSSNNPGALMVVQLARGVGPYLSVALLLMAVFSALRAWSTRQTLEVQSGLDSLRKVDWKVFEDLMAEAFRRQGFAVTEQLGGGADGGIDLTLRRDGEKTLVQCKRWRGKPVPVQTVRELYGVMTAEGAAAAKLVATTTFTSEAKAFAVGKPIEIIDGAALLELLKGVQTSGRIAAVEEASQRPAAKRAVATVDVEPTSLVCPRCGSAMVLRTARRGPNAGKQFWGCRNYPGCNGTAPV